MYSIKNSANWNTTTFTQEVADTDWSAYQVAITGTSRKFNIYSSNTTATQLSLYDGQNIIVGDKLLLSTDGTNFISGTTGAITTTAPVFTTPTKITANSAVNPSYFPTTGAVAASPIFLKPDGTKIWRIIGTTLTEYALSTPFDYTTAAANGRLISSFANIGFCFSSDGSRLYSCDTTYWYTRILGSAWDITTAGPVSQNAIGLTIPSTPRQMRISPDGQYVIAMAGGSGTTSGIIYTFQCSTPLQLSTASSLYTSTTFNGVTTAYSTFEFTPDGKTLLIGNTTGVSTPVGTIKAYACTIPWNAVSTNITQIGSTFTLTNADFTSVASNSSLGMFTHPNGITTTIFWGTTGFVTYTTDINTKQNINITSYGLGTAPTYAYYSPPRVFVDMEATAGQVNLMPIDQDFVSSTTTQAVFGANGTNLLATGDKILLNGSTTVTTTNVSIGSTGGLSPQYMGRSVNYITSTNKTLGLPTNPYAIKVRSDGSAIYFVSGGNDIYQYNLTTPWDITTAYLVNRITLSNTIVSGYGGNCNGIDIKPDGTKLYIHAYIPNNNACIEFTLTTPWNIGTATYTNRKFTTGPNTDTMYGGRFNETGTQYYYLVYDNSSCSTAFYISYVQLSTPYDMSSAGAPNIAYYAGANGSSPVGQYAPTLTPGGNTCITSASVASEQIMTIAGTFSSSAFSNVLNTSSGVTAGITFPSYGQVSINCCDFSPDGTRMVAVRNNTVYLFKCRTKSLTQYTATFAAQSTAPTSVYIPDRSIEQSITTTLSGGNMIFTTPQVLKTGRAVALRINSPYQGTTISNVTLNLWKT
jgi:hypothetical protein